MAEESKTLTSLAELGDAALPDTDIEPEPQIDRLGRTYATGKRKDAVAQGLAAPRPRHDHGQQAPGGDLFRRGRRSE